MKKSNRWKCLPSFFLGLSRSSPSSFFMNSSKSKVKFRHSVEYNGERTAAMIMECVKRWIDWSAEGLNHFYILGSLVLKSCAPNSNPGMAITLPCGIGQLSCSPLSFMRIHHLQRAKWLSPWSGTSFFTKCILFPSHRLSFIYVTALAIAMVALNLANLSVYAQEQVQDTQEV